MKRLILILMLGLNTDCVQAQSYFNVRDPLHSFGTVLTTVIPTQQGYVCTGVAWDSVNHISNNIAWQIIGVKYVLFDHQGHKVRDTIFERSHLQIGWVDGRSIYAGTNSTVRLTDGSLLAIAESYDTADVMRLGITKLDSLGRGQWFKEIDHPVCPNTSYPQAFFQPRDLKADGQGGWLVLSTISCQSFQSDALLTKLDSAFEVVWHKVYGSASRNEVARKIVVEPDGYLLAGGYNNTNAVQKNFTHQAQLIKTDTAGGVQWTWLSDAQKKVYAASDVVRTPDGGYLYCGWGDGYEKLSANQQYGTMYWQSWIEKLDVTRNVVWSKTLSEVNWGWGTNELTVLRNLPGGDIAVAGGMKYRPSLAAASPKATARWPAWRRMARCAGSANTATPPTPSSTRCTT